MSAQDRILHKTKQKIQATSKVLKIECCGSFCRLPTERMKLKKGLLISEQNWNENITYEGRRESD
jgi:hypothetical protein